MEGYGSRVATEVYGSRVATGGYGSRGGRIWQYRGATEGYGSIESQRN